MALPGWKSFPGSSFSSLKFKLHGPQDPSKLRPTKPCSLSFTFSLPQHPFHGGKSLEQVAASISWRTWNLWAEGSRCAQPRPLGILWRRTVRLQHSCVYSGSSEGSTPCCCPRKGTKDKHLGLRHRDAG